MGDVARNVFCAVVLPCLDLIYTAAGIRVKRNLIPVDKLGAFALDLERVVFLGVLALLRAVVAEISYIIKPHLVETVGVVKKPCGALLYFGVEVVAVFILYLKQPSHVVDARYKLPSALKLILHAKLGKKPL